MRDDASDSLSQMIDRAVAGPAAQLPYRQVIERRLGHALGEIAVYHGPEARAALRLMGARAATRGRQILLPEATPPLATVAHEVIHALQSQRAAGSAAMWITREEAPAEVEAERLAETVAHFDLASPAPVLIAGELAAEAVSLQRSDLAAPSSGAAVAERAEDEFSSALAAGPGPRPGPAVEAAEPAPPTGATEERAEAPGETPAEATPEEGAPVALPPAPAPGVNPEDVAAREAAIAEAEAILAAARDVDSLMDAFAAAPPTVKAREQGQLGQRMNELAQQETQTLQAELPELHAELNAQEEPVTPLTVEAPAAGTVTLEETPPGPAPEPQLPETPALGSYDANDGVARGLNYGLDEEPAARAEQIGESLQDVQTTDPEAPRSAGPPPATPLGGETDPQRLADQTSEGMDQARGARDDARAAVLSGPGPEQAQPRQMDEAYGVGELTQPQVAALAPVEGAQSYLAMGLPPEVETAFDQEQQAAMQASMAGATDQVSQATEERDRSREDAVNQAQTEADRLSTEADQSQRDQVTAARESIQTERQATLDAQANAVTDLETNAENRRRTDREAIDTRVRDDQAKIDGRYQEADTDIKAKVAAGERDAEEERRKAEREAEDQSWWDRAVNFVRDAFNALVSAIDSIFAAVRSAINAVLDAVKAFAMALIDAAAAFIKKAIAAFGEFLKGAIDALLGDIFPELAAKLNRAIDAAVAATQRFVDTVANGLKSAVAKLVDGLKAGLNKILDIYQAALSLAVGFVQAALTGDWSALARKLLEAVLKVAGISPESFYAFIGRAEETFQLILDDPGTFVGNLFDAFIGGVRRFADNFPTHLQAGLIGWLTGTLGSGGITIPERFDLMGVLDLARQILGLTWERLRQKAVKLVGEQNVARLEYVAGYIKDLIVQGWTALWERIQSDIANLREMVMEGIQSFLLERVLLAAITKIASLFNPVGAIVQLVLTAWNLYTFLRDQFQRIAQVVQAVIAAIADIARGVLAPAIGRVETVLAGLLPLAIDLLARLLGLGNVGAKVREIIEKVQGFIDRAINKLLQRVLAAFRGGGAATAPEKKIQQEAAARGVTDVPPGADPAVKKEALAEVQRRLRGKDLGSLGELRSILAETFRAFQPRGLKALDVDVPNEATMDVAIAASASEPERRTMKWKELFAPKDPAKAEFKTQPRNETHAAISVNGRRLGTVVKSDKDRHAEQNLIASHWQKALDEASKSVNEGKPTMVAVAINRAPCHLICSPLLTETLRAVDPQLKQQVRFILAPTGTYEPTERLTPEEVERQRKELEEVAMRLGRPASAVIREQLAKVVLTEDTTTFNDLRNLAAAGWDIVQLQARRTPTSAGIVLAEAAHKVAVEAGRVEVKK